MASPFRLFRKYQKTFLVIAGVLAMFIFVLADPLMSWIQSSAGGGGQRTGNTVVATWDGGSLNLRQLDMLTQRRAKISDFLRGLYIQAATSVEQEGGTPIPPTLPNFIMENTDFQSVRVGCVTTRVLSELAKQSGITVSDAVINHYLREWGLRRMGDAEIATLLSRVGMSDKTLFAGLRELLMGNYYFNSYLLATRTMLPEERWQDWKRINQRIAVEAASLPADDFLTEVPDPSEADLKQFYEEHKERVDGMFEMQLGKRLPSPNPGFREPRRVKLQYLVGNVDDWTQKVMDTVTDEEIADYYERNKRSQFIKTTDSSAADDLFEEDDSEESEEETGETASEVDDGNTDGGGEEMTDEAEEAETEAADPDNDESETEAEPADDESGQSMRQSPFRFAALQTDVEEASGGAADDVEAADAAGETASDADADDGGDEESDADDDDEDQQYEPLENVSDQIRRTLARDKAVVELQKVVDRTYATLQSTYNPYGFKVVSARTEGKEIPEPPASLSDYVAIAKETGLASEETVLLSQMALADTFVGKAFDAQSRREFVVQAMFGDKELYEPYRATDLDGNAYLVCKVEDVASRAPEFDEVRDKVIIAWKAQEAAKLALAKAEELAAKAKESGDPVAVVARGAGYEVATTDLFSWLTFGTTPAEMQRGYRLGEAPPLKSVGPDFMIKAFDLEPDDKVAVQNHDQTAAYVIQLDRREQTEEEMRKQFLGEANNWFGADIMIRSRWANAQRTLLGELTENVGLNLDKLEEFLAEDSQ